MGKIFGQALQLIFSGDYEVLFITLTSLRFSLLSTAIASALAVPMAVWLHFARFPAKRVIVSLLHTLMALPTVVIGLMVFSLLSRSGPLGPLGILFTPAAVITGQVFLSLPLITTLVHSGLSGLDSRFRETVVTLGARGKDLLAATLFQARFLILSALLAGFGRIVGEVGVSMMLGGNIRWYTRTMTTTIALETSKGNFQLGLALGIILMLVALAINGIGHILIKSEE
jgi:tungstate transport system permease protein